VILDSNWLVRRERQLQQAGRLIRARTPLLITGPSGVGKTAFVYSLIDKLEGNFETQWLNLTSNADPLINVELVLRELREHPPRKEMIVILDGAEVFKTAELDRVIRQFKNYKRVRSVIATNRNSKVELRGIREIELTYPQGKLYGLREQVVTAQKSIIEVVAPTVVTFNDVLIEKLKGCPTDLFKITPRQFEEVIADLLSGMGMEVELTPATRDGGKDILAYMDTPVGKLLSLVETKQHNKNRPVGVSLVRSLYETVVDHQASSGMLVTTSRFAKPAKQFQEKHRYQLELKDYGDVVNWLLKHKT
jgi:restriction system protein